MEWALFLAFLLFSFLLWTAKREHRRSIRIQQTDFESAVETFGGDMAEWGYERGFIDGYEAGRDAAPESSAPTVDPIDWARANVSEALAMINRMGAKPKKKKK